MYEKIYGFVQSVDNVVWGWAMILLLLGTHLFLTIRTGFIQRKTITKGIPLSVSKEDGADGEVSQFGALTTALASTIGTGNIIGVGTAIALGGRSASWKGTGTEGCCESGRGCAQRCGRVKRRAHRGKQSDH